MTNALAADAREPSQRASLAEARHNDAISRLLAEYDGKPLDVSVRQLVGPLPADDHTHSIYPYPARLVRHIPRLFLDATEVVHADSVVIDPFCGSGTVLVEAQQTGRRSLGIDSNPIAALVATVKTTPADPNEIRSIGGTALKRARSSRSFYSPPRYVEKWYDKGAYSALSRLAMAVAALDRSPEADAIKVAFALTARETSLADPRVPVPVRRKQPSARGLRGSDVWASFDANIGRLRARVAKVARGVPRAEVRVRDSRFADAWAWADAQASATLLTSPPYGAAQKYIRSTSLEAGWLGMVPDSGPIGLERLSVGREHLTREERERSIQEVGDPKLADFLRAVEAVNPLRASIYVNYFIEMSGAFRAGLSARPGIDTVILVCGTNTVAGRSVETHLHLAAEIRSHGFEEILVLRDPIRGRVLMTTRNGLAQPAQSEYIHILKRKPAPS